MGDIKKILDFKNIKFETNWASATTIVTLLIGVITLWTTNSNLKSKVESLSTSNTALTESVRVLDNSVSALNGSQDVTSKAIEIFMQNSPKELEYRIGVLEKKVFPVHVPTPVNTPFNNSIPH